MWRKGKRKDEEGDSDGPSKKNPKITSDDHDEIYVCEISKNRRVAVRNWNGKVVVDIRELYVKDGKQMPGKKGIQLTLDQWNILRDHVDEIDKAIAEDD